MHINPLIHLILLCLIGSVAGLIGGIFFLSSKKRAEKASLFAVPFAAGILLSAAFLHLIPEAFEEVGDTAYTWVLFTFLGAFFFEHYFTHIHHHKGHGNTGKSSVYLVVFGDTIHNFIDGVAIASAFVIDPGIGLIVALATLLHEIPHEIGDFGILMASGLSRLKTFAVNLISSLATFPGALMAFYFHDSMEGSTGYMLAVSAGVFLYLGASDFLPRINSKENAGAKKMEFLTVFFGVLVIILLTMFLPD